MLTRYALSVLLLTTGRCLVEVEGSATANNVMSRRRQLSQVDGNLSAPPWQAFRDTCQDEDVELSLWVDTHLYLVSKPAEEGKDWCNEVLLFHDAGDQGKAVMIYHEDSLVKDFPDVSSSSLVLSKSIPLRSVLEAFDQIKLSHSSGAASYDVVTNNCASLILEMLKALDIEAMGKVAEYTTSKLLENGKTIQSLRNSPYKSKLLRVQDQGRQASKTLMSSHQSPDDYHLSDEELMTRLVNHYIESQQGRETAVSSQAQGTPVLKENPRKRYLPSFQLGSIAGMDEASVRARVQRTPVQLHRYLQGGGGGFDFCTLCAGGTDPGDLSGSTGATWLQGFGYVSCEFAPTILLEANIPSDSLACANIQLSAYANCGCPTRPPLHPEAQACSLCPDPSYEFDLTKEIPEFPQPTDRDPLTCLDIQLFMQEFPAADCPTQQGSEGLSVFCGCPGAVLVEDCNLCVDSGENVPDNDLVVLPGEGTCGDVVDLIAMGLGEECAALQATAGVYCGCTSNDRDAVDYGLTFRPNAPPCRVCPDQQLLPDPTMFISFVTIVNGAQVTVFTSCGQLEYIANAFDACDAENTFMFRLACGCPSAMPTASPIPTSMPTDSLMPTTTPTESLIPSSMPTASPIPTSMPTDSLMPTTMPTDSLIPTTIPTESLLPTSMPTDSLIPSVMPTEIPTTMPMDMPIPTTMPTESLIPTTIPTDADEGGNDDEETDDEEQATLDQGPCGRPLTLLSFLDLVACLLSLIISGDIQAMIEASLEAAIEAAEEAIEAGIEATMEVVEAIQGFFGV